MLPPSTLRSRLRMRSTCSGKPQSRSNSTAFRGGNGLQGSIDTLVRGFMRRSLGRYLGLDDPASHEPRYATARLHQYRVTPPRGADGATANRRWGAPRGGGSPAMWGVGPSAPSCFYLGSHGRNHLDSDSRS